MASEKEPHDRAAIETCGVAAKDVPGLINLETMDFSSPATFEWWQSQRKAAYPHEEMFGLSVTVTEHLECPPDMVYDYLANVYSLEEWTASLRGFQHLGGGLYRGYDMLVKDTPIHMRIEAHPGPRVIDHLCAWDQGFDLWMRYHLRILDAMPTLGKGGSVLVWTNFRHANYNQENHAPAFVAAPRARSDRLWVGQMWDLFYAGHRIESQNLKKILEHRYRAHEGQHASK